MVAQIVVEQILESQYKSYARLVINLPLQPIIEL